MAPGTCSTISGALRAGPSQRRRNPRAAGAPLTSILFTESLLSSVAQPLRLPRRDSSRRLVADQAPDSTRVSSRQAESLRHEGADVLQHCL